MIYLDTSCLIKLLRDEVDSPVVREAVATEESVLVSSLVELEAEVQLKAALAAGEIRASQLRHLQSQLLTMRNFDPFHFRQVPASVFSAALRQQRNPQAVYCRSLDRLHLAAMEEMKVSRLMTMDSAQAKAAKTLKYEVVRPGLD